MRVIVFFDLPTETAEDRRNYIRFRKTLIRNGFLMMQESVYCRLLPSTSAGNSAIEAVRRNRPPKGLVQVLTITEKQFARMEYITGEKHTETLDTDERLVIL
ncbi:MAG: CRISPR-associated endonuclease Cas2 [Christensenellales bacterium]